MNYNLSITIKKEWYSTIEEFKGSDVNDVLRRASQRYYEIKVNMGVYSESAKRKMFHETRKHFATTNTSHIVDNLEKKKRILRQHDKCKIDLWKTLDDKIVRLFTESEPDLVKFPNEPQYLNSPKPPTRNDDKYRVEEKSLDILFKNKHAQKLAAADEEYEKDFEIWKNNNLKIDKTNNESLQNYNEQKKKIEYENEEKISNWNKKKESFYLSLENEVSNLAKFKTAYQRKEKQAIEKYNYELLNNKNKPLDFWDKELFIYFNDINSTLYIEYFLPSTTNLEAIKEIKYIQSKDVFSEIMMKQNEYEKYYDDVIYQVVILILYMICINDECNCIEAIAFNGHVKSIDKASGANIEPCIISLFVKKEEMLRLNLKQVDARICFRNLKGVGSSILANQTAVPPIIKFDKNDKRFIQSKEIVNTLSDGLNLAAMDWEDFEHLVREIFEKEFSTNGGEVKVTQASRDGGVDAIAFDPDPIRGGKIVIQAKRYTNTVGVNAVRDLYGTVVNEGATKGILVTTSDYGPDAYEFAKGKPITLLNGSNLLHLLSKHGHHAKIDLQEAKNIFSNK